MNAFKQVIIELDDGIEVKDGRMVMSVCKARKLWEVLGICLNVAESANAASAPTVPAAVKRHLGGGVDFIALENGEPPG